MGAEAVTAAEPASRQRQGRWKPLVRAVHIYASLLGLVLALFFGVTGFVLNHEDWFALDPVRARETGELPRDLVAQADPLAVVEAVRARFDVRGALVAFEPDPAELRLRFARPGEDTDVVIRRGDGAVQLERERGATLAALTDVHRGKRSGTLGKLLVDATAILLVAISLTGFALWLTLPKRRRLGLAALVLALGLLAIVGAYLFA